jgi:hypothetical protein
LDSRSACQSSASEECHCSEKWDHIPVRSLFFWRTIGSPRDIVLHVAAFAALGAALVLGRERPPRLGRLVLLGVGATLLLELGKVFVRGRHPALADALPNTLGLVAGALVTARLLARRRARAASHAR